MLVDLEIKIYEGKQARIKNINVSRAKWDNIGQIDDKTTSIYHVFKNFRT